MTECKTTIQDIATKLFKANVVKFGSFTTGSGAVTPVYFDLRVLYSQPSLMKDLSDLVSEHVNDLVKQTQGNDSKTNKIILCGIPYAAVPFATLVSVKTDIPMIMKRKQEKGYGTNSLIEGFWDQGDTCILIDDVVMFGNSVWETAEDLANEGLKCSHAVVILDRQQGAREKLERSGIKVEALITANQILESLLDANYITSDTCTEVKAYLEANQVSGVFKNKSCSSGKSCNK